MTQTQYLSDEQHEELMRGRSTLDYGRAIESAAIAAYVAKGAEPVAWQFRYPPSFEWRLTPYEPQGENDEGFQKRPLYAAPLSEVKAEPSEDRLIESARRLVEHADFNLGGILSADSKARDIPSRAVSTVKARHLAALRDALAARQASPQQGAAQSEVKGAARYSVEKHGNGWAIYEGRDGHHHGYNLGQLTETNEDIAKLVERGLRALAASAPTVGGAVSEAVRIDYEKIYLAADEAGWNYNLLCRLVREAVAPLAATPSSPAVEEASSTGAVRWKDQTIPHSEDQQGNCMQAAVASVLNLPMEAVPHFAANPITCWEDFERFFARHGIETMIFPGNHVAEGLYLASGPSERGTSHMVVMQGGKLKHDPHPSRAGLASIDHVHFLVTLDPAPAPAVPADGERPVAWMLEGVGVNDSGSRSVHMREPKNVDARYWKVVPVYARPSAAGADEGKDARYDCYSDSDGDYWLDCPDDIEFVEGLKVGDTYELSCGFNSERRTFRVTKAPDRTSDDYEVELMPRAARAGGETS